MKKIGIITYHFARNYGAVLQCYALQKYLMEKGYKVKVINYITKKQSDNNDFYKHGKSIKTIASNVLLFPFLKVRKDKNKLFDNFNITYLDLTRKVSNIEQLKQIIDEEKFDFIISGSDQVFNKRIKDFDLGFLLPFSCNSKKISYAASTGNATKEDIDSIKEYLDDFYKISIRERKDLSKFVSYNKSDIMVVPDPVSLISKNDWENIIKDSKKQNNRYLLCYLLHKKLYKNEFKIVNKIAKEKKLKVVIINTHFGINSFKKGTVFKVGPKEFINYLFNASFICTDSFHGTLFSLIFNKDFCCFDTKDNINDSRRKNILEKLGALDSLVYLEDEYKEKKLDYKMINEKLKQLKNEADIFMGDVDEESNKKYNKIKSI